MCLTKFFLLGKSQKCFSIVVGSFFLYVKSQKCVSRFFKKREQFAESAVGLNKEKFFELQQEREFISLLIMNDTKKKA